MDRYETENSVWMIDPDARIISRFPKSEDPRHPSAPYEQLGQPEQYSTLEFVEVMGDTCMMVTMPDGRWVRSGAILNGL